LPETLQDGGVYFDPQNEQSIASAIKTLIEDASLRQRLAARAKQLAESYSWQKCAMQTWAYIAHIYQDRSKRAEIAS
jgi:glycosyltransferase involved in cell wall biosynthesis